MRHRAPQHPVTNPGGVPVQVTDPHRHRHPDHHRPPACSARLSDLQELQAHGGSFRSGYRHLLGGDAPRCQPGDRRAAQAFLLKIEAAQHHGRWSAAERTRLSLMHRKWAARASGTDARFMVMGTMPGRPDCYQQRQIDAIRRRSA